MEKSLEKLDQYQAEYYAKLSQLPHFNQISTMIEDFLKAIISRGEFYTRVHINVLGDILASGTIKSMMETHRGTTNGGEATRREVTANLFGCDTSRMEPADYPKYGFLSQADAKRDLLVNAHMSMQFGDASIRLKKQRMMHRTTLCVGNSVNLGNSMAMIPTRTDNVKATCIVGLPHNKQARTPHDPLTLYYYMAMKLLQKQLSVDNFASLDQVTDDAPMIFEYFELQYHGILSLENDVERIDVIPSSREETEYLNTLKPKFEAIGIPLEITEYE